MWDILSYPSLPHTLKMEPLVEPGARPMGDKAKDPPVSAYSAGATGTTLP